MRASLAQLHARLRVTTIYVTHDQVEAMTSLGQRRGDARRPDPPGRRAAASLPEPTRPVRRGFIGSPAMNLVDAVIDGDEVRFGQYRVPLAPIAGRLEDHMVARHSA